ADTVVLGAGLDDPLRLAPAHVHDDVAERPVGEGLRAAEVDDREALGLVRPVAQARQALAGDVAQALPQLAAQAPRARDELAPAHPAVPLRGLREAPAREPPRGGAEPGPAA